MKRLEREEITNKNEENTNERASKRSSRQTDYHLLIFIFLFHYFNKFGQKVKPNKLLSFLLLILPNNHML